MYIFWEDDICLEKDSIVPIVIPYMWGLHVLGGGDR